MAKKKKIININNNVIYKSNKLIESCYNLTTAENRLIYLAMSKLEYIILDKNLNIEEVEYKIKRADFDLIFISVLDYKNTFNIKSNSLYSDLVEIANSLYEKEVYYLKENGDFGRKRWVITCEYDKDEKGVRLQFHPDMIRDLLIFKSEYTSMLFENFVTQIKGKYSFRLYELCKQYMRFGKRDFYVDDLRFKLMLMDDEYKRFSDFKRMLFEAIKEINNNTDVCLEYEELERNRKARKVTKIRFNIKAKESNKQISLLDDVDSLTNINTKNQIELISSWIGVQISAQQARDIITNTLNAIDKYKLKGIGSRDYILEKVAICKSYVERNGSENYIGLLISAIKNNWENNVVKGKEKSNFNNFEQRNYNIQALEEQALGLVDYNANDLYSD